MFINGEVVREVVLPAQDKIIINNKGKVLMV